MGVNSSKLIQFFEDLEESEDIGDVSGFPDTLEPDLVSVRQIGQRIVDSLSSTLQHISANEVASGLQTIVIDLDPIDIEDLEDIVGISLIVRPDSSNKQVLSGRLSVTFTHSRDLTN